QGRHLTLAAERRTHERDGHRANHVVPRSFEKRVRRYRHHELEVAGGPIGALHVPASFDGARRSTLDTGRNRNLDRSRDGDETRPRTSRTRVRNELAGAEALRARAVDSDREKPLLKADTPAPMARLTCLARVPRSRPRSVAVFTTFGPLVRELLLRAEGR